MKIRKSDIRRIIIPLVIVVIVFSAIYVCIVNMQFSSYAKEYNLVIDNIINNIKEKYPEVQEGEIIEILRNKSENTETILKKYGYQENDIYIKLLEDKVQENTIIDVIILIVFGIVIVIAVMLYISKQNKKVEEINSYLKRINNGKYNLKIEENTDDELSKLRNELYKTTILLKESAENSKVESNNLSRAMEDISHQLKTPLTSIRIMIDNLYENPEMELETRKDFIKTISKQIDWISSLVISLLKLAKFDSGTIVMTNKKINVKELILEVLDNLSVLIEIKNEDIQLDIAENVELIADYKWQLEAITNILKNSIEHSKENSKINIKVEDSSVLLKIIIQDFGDGISNKDIRHIFDRFYKTSNSSENSMGIGLALSKAIIEKSNGYITVKSKLGKGTTFVINYIK